MKGRQGISGNNNNNHNNTAGFPTDLLVCFPARAHHLTLTPKPICSPSRSVDPTKRHRSRPAHPLFRSRTGKYSGGGGASDEISDEPTSPTVTCAGQIKVQPRSRPGSKAAASSSRNNKGWLSVVEEMGKLQSKKPLMQFLGAFRTLRFDLHCFGSFHGAVDCSTDEDERAEEEEQEEEPYSESSTSRNIFSKWFMLLEQNQRHEPNKETKKKEDGRTEREEEELTPPPNALLLMRCRSAPAKVRTAAGQADKALGAEMDQEDDKEKKDRVLLMSYGPNFDKLSTDISKETWIVGSLDPLTRSRSWKR